MAKVESIKKQFAVYFNSREDYEEFTQVTKILIPRSYEERKEVFACRFYNHLGSVTFKGTGSKTFYLSKSNGYIKDENYVFSSKEFIKKFYASTSRFHYPMRFQNLLKTQAS